MGVNPDQGGHVHGQVPQQGQHQAEEGQVQVQHQGPAELPPQEMSQGIPMWAKAPPQAQPARQCSGRSGR
eukprot:365669-Prorocentrum_lima.AAC.1